MHNDLLTPPQHCVCLKGKSFVRPSPVSIGTNGRYNVDGGVEGPHVTSVLLH